MYIFLDESKALHKKWWKFILAGLVTSLKPGTIEKIYNDFLKHTGIKEYWGEIKSFDRKYRNKIEYFYNFIKYSKYSEQIQFIGVYAKNYKENWKNYFECLKILIYHTIKYSKILNKKFNSINIIADNIKLDYKKEKIKKLLNEEKSLIKKSKFTFTFSNSKKYWWIKFSDFVAWKLSNVYITEKENIDKDFIEYFVNEEISFIILE